MSSRAVFRAGIAAAISPVVETPIFLDGPFCAAENERPVRGDSRTGQAIWALGVDGRSRRIQPSMGRDDRSTLNWSRQARRTFKTVLRIFNFDRPSPKRKSPLAVENYCAAGLISSAAGLSDTAGPAGGFRALTIPTSGVSEASFAGLPEASASGTAECD